MKQTRTKSETKLIADRLKQTIERLEELEEPGEEEHEQLVKEQQELTTQLEKAILVLQQEEEQQEKSKKNDNSKFKIIREMSISKVEDEGLSYLEYIDSEVCEYANMEGKTESGVKTVNSVNTGRSRKNSEESEESEESQVSDSSQEDEASDSHEESDSSQDEASDSSEASEDEIRPKEVRLNPFPLDKSINLIYGPPQSGKTKRIQTLSFAHMLFNKCPSIVILRNSNDDVKQMKSRCDQFAREHKEFIFPKKDIKSILEYAYVGTSSVEKLRRCVKNNFMIIAIANSSQISKLEQVLTPGVRYLTVIDEADSVIGAYSKEYVAKFRKILHRAVLKNSGKTYAVTATTFDLIFSSDQIKTSKIYKMKINPNYCGIKKIQMCSVGKIGDDDLKTAKKAESCFEADKYIRPLLEDLSMRNEYFRLPTDMMYSRVAGSNHPMVLLIKNTHFVENQRVLLNEIVDIGNWTEGIVYNGEGLVIQSRYLKSLKKIAKNLAPLKSGVNTGETIVTGSKQTRIEAEENGGKRCLHIKAHISVGMQCFRELIKTGVKISHLVIIADRMADRGISFVSTDYKMRLTCQYYVPSSTATMSQKLQAIRLCGVYDDNLPSMLFAPPDVCEDLVKANLGQDELINRLKESESDEGSMTFFSGSKYSRSKLPNSKWGTVKIPCQIVEGSDGGVPRKNYTSALTYIKPVEGLEHDPQCQCKKTELN